MFLKSIGGWCSHGTNNNVFALLFLRTHGSQRTTCARSVALLSSTGKHPVFLQKQYTLWIFSSLTLDKISQGLAPLRNSRLTPPPSAHFHFVLEMEVGHEMVDSIETWSFSSANMNVTLIGMAGAGKSYIGRRLAERLGLNMLDVDRDLWEMKYGKPIQEILDELGEELYVAEEERLIIDGTKSKDNLLISPPGSVAYQKDALQHLKDVSTIIYLRVPFSVIKDRKSVV